MLYKYNTLYKYHKYYNSNDGVGFFPGHASLAYTFFLGPAGTFGTFTIAIGAFTSGTDGVRSTSGAKFGACMKLKLLLPIVPNCGDVGVVAVGEVCSLVFGKSEYKDGLYKPCNLLAIVSADIPSVWPSSERLFCKGGKRMIYINVKF